MNEEDRSEVNSLKSSSSKAGRRRKVFKCSGEIDQENLNGALESVSKSTLNPVNELSYKDDWEAVTQIYYEKMCVRENEKKRLYNYFKNNMQVHTKPDADCSKL